ncbi:uncharacterized protein Pyn_04067 [Prunus yedoensis var. nudiflora]|uniref:Mitochondrial import inner membrane translocase subunit TIM50 n=1 Tax=Prunus yedoensis var. nudiflora TaxID=2094558 RepID=A0A314Y2Y1_PRUYE|nr:uncharacterized protein Pyn_04067 [Prunus yedoensis var. nudiflora]
MSEKLKGKVECSGNNSSEAKECSLPLEKLNLGPRKKLLVLSLGGLLCHRVHRYERAKIPSFRYVDASYGSFRVYKRPHSEDFMKFCLERFDVGIWSSAKEWYLDNALDCVMKGLRSKLVFAWDQDKCTDSGFKTLEKRDKPLFLKELKKVWETLQGPAKPPHTAICPAEYKVDQVDDMALGPKGELRLYLDGLADADDVPSYVKEHPFGQPAVTTAHSDWGYYSKIISRFQKD